MENTMLRAMGSALALLLAGAATSGVMAQDCPPGKNIGATISAGPPCAPGTQAKKPTVVRSAPKQPDTKAPGTYRYGNTTVHIGGTVSTDLTVRGR